ncbi:MAG: hypothetical protein WDZ84_13215 [Rhodovibrionaceae bacterium]
MDEASYGRGQAEWALWRSFTVRSVTASQEVPKVFRTRIKRLLEIDRHIDFGDADVPPEADYAFAQPADESGEIAYRAIDVFCLAIALDLLDAGFQQSEVVFLMRYLRPELERRFPGLLKPPSLIDRQRHRAKDYPNVPSDEKENHGDADRRLFMVLRKVEMKEIGSPEYRRRDRLPIFLEPLYCEGISALTKELNNLLPQRRRAVTVLELAANARAVSIYLEQAPIIQRGRPKKEA